MLSYADLKYRVGCIPLFWQLLKNLHEKGVENLVIPYAGNSVESLWWKEYPNPAYKYFKTEQILRRFSFKWNSDAKKSNKNKLGYKEKLANFLVAPKWYKKLKEILEEQEDIDAIILYNIPLNHMLDLPEKIREIRSDIKIIFYDGDMPVHLPSFGGFKTGYNPLIGVDLSQYDTVITNSEGAESELKEMGARKTETLHWGVDPSVFVPKNYEKKYDIFFYGIGTEFRKNDFNNMLTSPSYERSRYKFLLGGHGFTQDEIGNMQYQKNVPIPEWINLCCKTKINIDVVRTSHSSVYGTSNGRKFEMGALGTCIVSSPHKGVEKWFKVGKEIIIVENKDETLEIYDQLLNDDPMREEIGINMRNRILKDHTYKIRAEKLIKIIKNL